MTLPYVFIGYTYPTLRLGWRLGGSTTTLPLNSFCKTDIRGLDYNIAPDRGYDVRSRRPPRRGRAAHLSPLLRLWQPLLRLGNLYYDFSIIYINFGILYYDFNIIYFDFGILYYDFGIIYFDFGCFYYDSPSPA